MKSYIKNPRYNEPEETQATTINKALEGKLRKEGKPWLNAQ